MTAALEIGVLVIASVLAFGSGIAIMAVRSKRESEEAEEEAYREGYLDGKRRVPRWESYE